MQDKISQAGPRSAFQKISASRACLLGLAAIAFAGAAHAQAKLGTYSGTVVLNGTEIGKTSKSTFAATVKIDMPLTSGNAKSAMAEISDVDKPSATATITQWDLEAKNASPDSDGKITSWTCKLAEPTTVPMNASGVLNVDFAAKKHSMFVALVSLKPLPFNCVNSRSGQYKEKKGVSLAFGTNEPDVLPYKELPFTDPMRLTAKFKLVPVSAMKGQYGPLDQEWDFKLSR